jgi:ABC-type molybdate transport system substrate-binding protein
MDEKQKRRILKELEKEAQKAKHVQDTGIEFTLKSGGSNFLSKHIKTKEQADFFMKLLRSLPPS